MSMTIATRRISVLAYRGALFSAAKARIEGNTWLWCYHMNRARLVRAKLLGKTVPAAQWGARHA